MVEFDVEKWVDQLQAANVTFETKSFDLTTKQIEALIDYYAVNVVGRRDRTVDQTQLDAMQRSIESMMKQLPGGAWFVRLSARSPKDAAIARIEKEPSVVQKLVTNLLGKRKLSQLSANDRIALIFDVSTQIMACRNAKQVFHGTVRIESDCVVVRVGDGVDFGF
jgi:predicted FMN-binding regulatory protein PaiB